MNENDRSIISMTMLGHSLVHTYELSIPILIPIWMAEFAVNEATIGIVVAAGYGLFGLGSLPGGVLTDRYGSHRLITGCLLGMGASFLLLGLVPNVIGLTLALLVWGAAASVYHPSGLTLISTGFVRRGEGFAYHGMAGNVGIALGPLFAAILLTEFTWQVVVVILAVPALLGGLLTTQLSIDEMAATTDRTAEAAYADGGIWSLTEFRAASRRLFLGGFIIVFPLVILEGLYYRGSLTFLPNLLETFAIMEPITVAGRSLEPAQYIYIGLLVIGMVGQYVAGRLTDHIRPEHGMLGVFTLLVFISVLFIPAANRGPGALLVVSALLGIVLFAEQPFLQATAAEYSGTDIRGLSYGYLYLGAFGIGALGAAMSGAVLTYATYDLLFLLLAGIAAIAGGFAALLSVRGQR
jgi:MFS family permease